MRSITDLLLNHPIPGIRQSETRHRCAEVLTILLGVPITPSEIKYEDGKLLLSIPPVLKSALILKQKELTEALLQKGVELKGMR